MNTDRSGREFSSASMDLASTSGRTVEHPEVTPEVTDVASVRPSLPQKRYLERGLKQAGGKLPLFDLDGREIPRKTVEACIAHGWAEAWTSNPIKPEWLVCRLTAAGYRVLGHEPPPAE
jgi:hypothetical protein